MTAPEPTPCTPTDAQVRYAWAYQASPGVRVTRVMSDERDAEFDRWLTRVRAEARRDALSEAANAYTDYEGDRGAAMVVRRWLRALAAETPGGAA